jgi:DNA topoisomerase I
VATARTGSTTSRRGGSRAARNGLRLVIVESPTKARKISGYLGPDYVVESSIGHIRDLPRNAADVPARYKGEPWARLGVNVDEGFAPLYVISPDRRQQVTKLRDLLKGASELYLATDEDREGEAIAWHLVETLKPTVPIKRMVFHEITPQAIQRAVDNPRGIDEHLVDAQETRRILDRLYGYEVSPVLWKKVMPRLSAGRVQSVATRIVVERERARMRFREANYWDIEGTFAVDTSPMAAAAQPAPMEPATFTATLVTLDGDRIATGRDFDPETGRAASTVVHLDEPGARGLAARLDGADFAVTRVEEKPYRRRPYAPFMTSTLQQEAGRKLRFSAERTMRTAQRLYENGYITYMRTDSTNLSDSALAAARQQARELYGAEYVPPEPRRYVRKVKNAQEAHEAIRPAGEMFRTPGEVAGELSTDEFRLYELIWQRTLASQMADAVGTTLTVRLAGTSSTGERAEFAASGRTITFAGFLRAYVEGHDESDVSDADDTEKRLPRLERGQPLVAEELRPQGHTTTRPPRFTEASLVKALEELGIGRPSTYASILRTIQERGYIWKKGSALVPSWVAFAVVGLLESHFARLVDYRFTADVEQDLDNIADGEEQSVDWLTRFYFGSDRGHEGGIARAGGLKRLVAERLGDIDARGVNSIPLFEGVVVRVGRYGPYLERSDGARASLPEDLPPDELTPEKVAELFAAPSGDRVLGRDPETGLDVVAKAGRFGPYVTSGDRTASLLSSMSLDTVTLDDALRLLQLPRELGTAPDGEQVVAQNGRYGPFVRKGNGKGDSRSLESEEQLFTITLDEAMALFAEPKRRGRRVAAPAGPLRELGDDPDSGKPIVVRDGRFGPYVTDGETNASLRKGDSVDEITLDRATELLAERRARGPAQRPAKRAPAKKAPAKKAPAKTATAKKATAKKASAKKASAKNATARKAPARKAR